MTTGTSTTSDVENVARSLYTDGIAALKGAFSRDWVADVRADMEAAFDEAIARPGGAVGRGPKRYYVEIHPEQLRGFVDLVTHPWVTAVSETVLGRSYLDGMLEAAIDGKAA